MTDKKNQPAEKTRLSWSWLRMALSLREKIKLGDKQVIFIWAVVVGALGALMALVFEMGVELVQDVLTGRTSYRQIQVFQEMAGQDPAWCIFVPAAGGLLAGLTLLFTHRFVPAKATEYMEAVALGNGYVPPKPSLLRSLSAVFSVGSGASIGREGPLVQAAAVEQAEGLNFGAVVVCEQAGEDGAQSAVDAVYADSADRVVYLELLIDKFDTEYNGKACADTDDNRTERSNHIAACGDTNKTCKRSVKAH